MKNSYDFKVSCQCGAVFESSGFTVTEVERLIARFNKDHKACREPSVFEQVFGEKATEGQI